MICFGVAVQNEIVKVEWSLGPLGPASEPSRYHNVGHRLGRNDLASVPIEKQWQIVIVVGSVQALIRNQDRLGNIVNSGRKNDRYCTLIKSHSSASLSATFKIGFAFFAHTVSI